MCIPVPEMLPTIMAVRPIVAAAVGARREGGRGPRVRVPGAGVRREKVGGENVTESPERDYMRSRVICKKSQRRFSL